MAGSSLMQRAKSINRYRLDGRRALIFGAGGGIGRETALVMAGLGAVMVLSDKMAPNEVAEAINASGGRAQAHSCDVASSEDIGQAVKRAGHIDILIYLAAICPWEEWDTGTLATDFDAVMSINLRGPLLASRAVLPHMKTQRWGRIVLCGSIAGKMGGLVAGPHYVASKGGLHALVKWLARHAAPYNVLVNGIAPASTATPMMQGQTVDVSRIPLGRMSTPEDIAWPIAFLASDAASYICGTILDANGGVYMA
jgi:NAD(P)-dependent dehydrogenase (short-subunit alcohol dehydrogenase family)